jgi:MtN3 and saliva related transmembrane protein
MGQLQWIDYLGLFGAFLSSITFLPQVFKAWKTRSVDDISAWMLVILMGNVTTWLVYGIVKSDVAIIIANAIIMGLTLLLAWFKVSFGGPKDNGRA